MDAGPMESAASPGGVAAAGGWRPLVRTVLLLALVGLCGAGLFAAPFTAARTPGFWLTLVGMIGAGCLGVCLAGGRGASFRELFLDQALQWAGAAAAVWAILWLAERRGLAPEAQGPMLVLLIAYSVYLSGIRHAGSLIAVALLMAATAAGAVLLERVVLLAAGLAAVLALAAFFARPFLAGLRRAGRPEPPPGATGGTA